MTGASGSTPPVSIDQAGPTGSAGRALVGEPVGGRAVIVAETGAGKAPGPAVSEAPPGTATVPPVTGIVPVAGGGSNVSVGAGEAVGEGVAATVGEGDGGGEPQPPSISTTARTAVRRATITSPPPACQSRARPGVGGVASAGGIDRGAWDRPHATR